VNTEHRLQLRLTSSLTYIATTQSDTHFYSEDKRQYFPPKFWHLSTRLKGITCQMTNPVITMRYSQ